MSALLSDKQSERLRFAEDYGDKVEVELEKTQLENVGLRTQLAEVTRERDRLRESLGKMCGETLREGIDLYIELGGKYGKDHPLVIELRNALALVNTALAAQPEPKPEAPKCAACDDGLVWHEKEPGFQQWSTKCGVCNRTGRAR